MIRVRSCLCALAAALMVLVPAHATPTSVEHTPGRSTQLPRVPQPEPAHHWVARQSALLAHGVATAMQHPRQAEG